MILSLMGVRSYQVAIAKTVLLTVLCIPIVQAQEEIERTFETPEFSAAGFRISAGAVPAIRGFDIGYTSSDHHIRDLAVGPNITSAPLDAGDYLILLRDDSGDYPISGSVKLSDVGALGHHLEVSRADCRGECRLRIPHLVSDEAFVLTGFDFERSSDSHVRQVKVRQMAHNDHIYVKLVDDSGTETYRARVFYSVVPRSALGPLMHERSEVPARGTAFVSRPPGVALLQSFDFRFLDGDEHLQRITVDLSDNPILLRFSDRGGDDRFEWMVEYSILR